MPIKYNCIFRCFLFSLVGLIFCAPLYAQECDYDDSFMGQLTIDNFSEMYPGCKVLKGSFSMSAAVVNLEGLSQLEGLVGNIKIDCKITSLHGLHNLEYVNGTFNINGNSELLDLKGLSNLKSTGFFNIQTNPKIESLEGLNALDSVSSLNIQSNLGLKDISDLENLRVIDRRFSLENNVFLESISGINKLKILREELFIDHRHPFLTKIDGLNGLETIEQLDLRDLGVESISGFQALTTIEKDLSIWECEKLTDLSGFTALKNIKGDLRIEDNQKLTTITGFQSLEKVQNRLAIKKNPLLDNLSSFLSLSTTDILDISENNQLKSLFINSQLEAVNSIFLNRNYEIRDLKGFEGLDSIPGFLTITENLELTSLGGLENIEFVGESIGINRDRKLKNLFGLSKLKSLGGSLILTGLNELESLEGLEMLDKINGRLSLEALRIIEDFIPLKRITTIDGRLSITGLRKIRNLHGLENIERINGPLVISGNTLLTDIDAIKNIDPQSIGTGSGTRVQITRNPLLSECGIENICALLYTHGVRFYVEQNKPGCNELNEIRCINNGLAGKVFLDLNKNKIQDTLEAGISNIVLNIFPSDINLYPDLIGRYYFEAVEDSTYNIKVVTGDKWEITTDSTQYSKTFTAGNEENDQNTFGLFPTEIEHAGEINIASYETRCNVGSSFIIKYQNTGNFYEDGKVTLALDSLTTYISSIPEPTLYDTLQKVLEWSFDSLYPYEQREIYLELMMPDETNTGEEMDFYATLIYNTNQTIADSASYFPIVLCSYDPNDITASPPGKETAHNTIIGTPLEYTIRFQNTGNASAIDVKILDTLVDHFDMSTFKILNASFPVNTSVKGNIVEFRFDNIRLPDSLSNEPESHGFVKYYIETMKNIQPGTLVENTAFIFFDFNPPIVTNTAFNTFVHPFPTVSTNVLPKNDFVIYPNPTHDVLYVNSRDRKVDAIILYDAMGRLTMSSKTAYISVKSVEPGIYFAQIKSGNYSIIKKVIVLNR